MKFIEVHPIDYSDRRIYINLANIMAVGETEQQEALIFYNTVRSPGDPDDKEPVFAYVHGNFYRDTIREASALLESLSETMEE